MEFRPEQVEAFKTLFDERKEKIRAFPGCNYLELLQGTAGNNSVFFTYSYWQSAEDLDKYRYSDLFADTWALTKAMFATRAEAISTHKLHSLT